MLEQFGCSIPKDAVGRTLIDIAKKNDKICVLSSDVSKSVNIYEFSDFFPGRYFEMGIAEQSTVSVAGGLAAEGFIPVYAALSIFSCCMTFPQIRQVCNNNLNVKIIGTHAGVDDGADGPGHHATEDLAISRVIPRLTVLCPSDENEVAAAVRAMVDIDGPVYMRVARENQPVIEELVKRDFKKKYKRTVLGMAWSILAPLLQLAVMTLVFTKFFGRNTPHFMIYIFCGMLVFNFFSDATKGGMSTIMGNAGIFTKVNVPKYLFLLSRNIQALINFGLILVIFFIFVAFDGLLFTWKFLCLLYPICCLILFNIGIGMALSALFVFFRDVQYLYDVFTQLLMYMSAVFYTIDRYSETVRKLFLLNPMYLFIRYFRKIVIEATVPTIWFHLLMAADVVIALGAGCFMYKKYNTKFLYYV